MNCFKKIKLNKRQVVIYLLTLWFIVSLGYLSWNYFVKSRQALLLEGYTVAIRDLVDQSEKGCDPFQIFFGEKAITLINYDCLSAEPSLEFSEE